MTKEGIQRMLDEGRHFCPDCGDSLEYVALVRMEDNLIVGIPDSNAFTYCFDCENRNVDGATQEEIDTKYESGKADMEYCRWKDGELC